MAFLDPLQPEKIGRLFSPPPRNAKRWNPLRLRPKTRFVWLGLAAITGLLILAEVNGGLTNKPRLATAISLIIHGKTLHGPIGLPLLQDPVGIIATLMTLATPLFCTDQVAAIAGFNEMNERNISYRAGQLRADELNTYTCQANRLFTAVGRRLTSGLLLVISAGFSFLIDVLINRWGLYASWNQSGSSAQIWKHAVYEGWWANPHAHFVLAVALWAVGCYLFYFLIKQLAMGIIFALYVRRVTNELMFGVTPDMSVNSDGFWGLRGLRHFMQVTYASTLGHFVMVLGILVVWLPFNVFTILVLIAVMIANGFEVIYPSVLAHAGAINEKINYVRYLRDSAASEKDRIAAIDKVWANPTLPFRVRSTVSAATLYLVIPLLLALIPAFVGKR